MRYSFLEPINVGPFTLRNRIIKPAMAEYICHEDGTVSSQFIEFYRGIARGGASLIVPGIVPLDDTVTQPPTFMGTKNTRLTDEKFLPGLRKAVEAVHAEGARIMFQLWHSGCYVTPDGLRSMLNDLTREQIHRLEDKFLQAARLVKRSGADGVEFHMAHTYLASQFLSPYFNKRTDEYGADTVENATRFAKEVIERVSAECCDDTFGLIVKLQGSDFVEGGITPHWAGQAAGILEKAGAQMFTVNAGGALVGYEYMSDNGHQPEGWKVDLATVVKEYVSVPVAASGNIRHPDYMHQLIRDGKCDMIALGRELLADPEYVNKCAQGRENELRYCVSCLYCFTQVPGDGSVPGCTVNPYCKCEQVRPELKQNGGGRVVAIVGAGPSGLEAAVVLAQRGFKPVIFEKQPYLGGLVDLAAVPPHKGRLSWIIDYYARQLRRLSVEVRLSTEATVENLRALHPYAVFLASGTDEVVPGKIPGIRGENVFRVRDVLARKVSFQNKTLAVIGGGMTGVETAHLLALQGNRVTVVEMMPEKPLPIADKLSFGDAFRDGVEIHYEHQLMDIQTDGIRVKDLRQGQEKTWKVDAVILSMGIRPNTAFTEEIQKHFDRVVLVGDAGKLGKIPDNLRSGAEAAYHLE